MKYYINTSLSSKLDTKSLVLKMCDHRTDSYGIYLFFLEYKYVVFQR